MSNAAQLATRYARRPLLLEPTAARSLLQHIAASDPRGMETESRFAAALRKIGIGRDRARMQDVHDDFAEDRAAEDANAIRPGCYAPLWAQQTYGDPQDEGFAWSLYEGAAMMEIDGAISAKGGYFCGEFYHGYDTILAAAQEAIADGRVGGLFIKINSPGGVVDEGLPTLAAFMRSARAQAGGKPIHVYADMASSAGYWIAAQADRIAAGSVGLVGSIGAVLVHEDWSEALKKAGIAITPIQFGSQKTAGAFWDALSDDARADLQAEIDQCGRNFVADAHAGRALLSAEAMLATNARVFMAKHDDPTRSGLALGLVDAIETEQQAFEGLLAKINDPVFARTSGNSPQAAAQAGHGAPETSSEHDMRLSLTRKGPTAAQTQPKPAADGKTGEEKTAAAMEDCPDCSGSGENPDGTPCKTCDGTGEVDEGEGGVAATTGADEAKAISASAEAKTHPGLALAAIQTGMTLAQFQAQAVAAGTPQRGSRIDADMAGARRLGADGPKPESKSKKIDARGYYASRAKAMGNRAG